MPNSFFLVFIFHNLMLVHLLIQLYKSLHLISLLVILILCGGTIDISIVQCNIHCTLTRIHICWTIVVWLLACSCTNNSNDNNNSFKNTYNNDNR